MFDLLYAAAVGDLPSVRYCVQRSQKANFLWGDLTRTCGRGRAALHYAVLGGHDTVVRELIRAGAQLSWQDRDGATCLMIAAERGNELVLQLLLSHGADVHICARDGSTAAHFAARKGHMECLQCLIKAGSHIATTDCMGRTLIHWAAEIGNKAMVELLLEQGCPVSGGTQHVLGETPLHVAVKHGHADVVKLLLRKRAAVNAVTKEGQTPLHVCCSSSLAPAPALQRVAALLLSEKRLHIRALDAQGKPAHFYTKDFTLKDLILMAIQGTLPTPPESDDGMHKKPPVVPPPAAIKPVIATPHPLIPGHRWAESRAECTPRSGMPFVLCPCKNLFNNQQLLICYMLQIQGPQPSKHAAQVCSLSHSAHSLWIGTRLVRRVVNAVPHSSGKKSSSGKHRRHAVTKQRMDQKIRASFQAIECGLTQGPTASYQTSLSGSTWADTGPSLY
eukprot:jgi/Ulvmu1/9260/UM050_0009.1